MKKLPKTYPELFKTIDNYYTPYIFLMFSFNGSRDFMFKATFISEMKISLLLKFSMRITETL